MMLKLVSYCLLAGLAASFPALGAGNFGWWWLSGVVLAAAFFPIARWGPQGALKQFGVIAPVLLVVTVLCTWSEALIFLPGAIPDPGQALVGAGVTYLVVAVALALLARLLRVTARDGEAVARRSPAAATVMVLISGVVYVLAYLIFGSITYFFFTRAYYPDGVEAATRLGLWLWAIQLGRGVLMTLAVLPAIYTLRLDRWRAALAIGALVWVAGGLAPLIPPSAVMGTTQRMMHVVEILTQNFTLGLAATLLLRPHVTAAAADPRRPAGTLRHRAAAP